MNYNDCLYYGFSVLNLVMAVFAIYKLFRIVTEKGLPDLPKQRIAAMLILVDVAVIIAQCYSLYNEGIMWPHKAQEFLISIFSLMFAKYLNDKD